MPDDSSKTGEIGVKLGDAIIGGGTDNTTPNVKGKVLIGLLDLARINALARSIGKVSVGLLYASLVTSYTLESCASMHQ